MHVSFSFALSKQKKGNCFGDLRAAAGRARSPGGPSEPMLESECCLHAGVPTKERRIDLQDMEKEGAAGKVRIDLEFFGRAVF